MLVLGFVFPDPGYRRQLLAGMLAVSTPFFSLNGITFIMNLTASRSIVALLSCVLVSVVGVLVLGIAVSWQSVLLLVPGLVLGTLCFTFLGLTISNLVQNENQVAMLNNIVTLPMIFSSATFYSLSNAPAWVKAIGHVFPFCYLLDGEHAAFAGNAAGIVFPSLILLGFTVLSMLLAFVTFRWDPNAPVMRRVLRAHVAKVDHAS
jgi:ABC-2 type transport system permease protein